MLRSIQLTRSVAYVLSRLFDGAVGQAGYRGLVVSCGPGSLEESVLRCLCVVFVAVATAVFGCATTEAPRGGLAGALLLLSGWIASFGRRRR